MIDRAALACAALLAAATPALAHGAGGPAEGHLVGTVSVAGGGEADLSSDEGRAGVFEAEVTGGWQLRSGLRPELGIVFGTTQGGHVALRPGARFVLPGSPFFARAAFDLSNARQSFGWRWLLAGLGVEVRMTDVLGLFAEGDVGLPLTTSAGFPVLVRAGATFRF